MTVEQQRSRRKRALAGAAIAVASSAALSVFPLVPSLFTLDRVVLLPLVLVLVVLVGVGTTLLLFALKQP